MARWSVGNGSINEFAFSPDHVLLAIVSQDGFLRIFDYEKMELVAYMKSYFGGLLCVSVCVLEWSETTVIFAGMLVSRRKIRRHGR